MSEETYYERADKVVSSLNELVRTHTNSVVNGVHDRNEYWNTVGYIQGLKKALDIFIKKEKGIK